IVTLSFSAEPPCSRPEPCLATDSISSFAVSALNLTISGYIRVIRTIAQTTAQRSRAVQLLHECSSRTPNETAIIGAIQSRMSEATNIPTTAAARPDDFRFFQKATEPYE